MLSAPREFGFRGDGASALPGAGHFPKLSNDLLWMGRLLQEVQRVFEHDLPSNLSRLHQVQRIQIILHPLSLCPLRGLPPIDDLDEQRIYDRDQPQGRTTAPGRDDPGALPGAWAKPGQPVPMEGSGGGNLEDRPQAPGRRPGRGDEPGGPGLRSRQERDVGSAVDVRFIGLRDRPEQD